MLTPLLFTKTGTIESEPFGFYETLAATYQADRHNSDELRLELSNGRPVFNAQMSRLINGRMLELTLASLKDGKSVVYDGFLNTPNRRQEVHSAASALGKIGVVSLSMHAPMGLIDQRIHERFEDNALSMENEFYNSVDEVVHVAKRIFSGVEWPKRAKGERTLHLDGTLPIDDLLVRIHEHLQTRRLR